MPVGGLYFSGRDRARSASFVYARSWLARPDRFPITPVGLALKSSHQVGRPYEAPLSFYDASPDGWGQSILSGAYPTQYFGLGEYLAATGDERTGYLSFGHTPDEGPDRWSPPGEALISLPTNTETLDNLYEAVTAVENGDAKSHHFHLLVRHSADQGGARPKASVLADGLPHIVKFPAFGDVFDDPKVEGVCLELARLAGIETPIKTTIQAGSKTALLVRRFDRSNDGRGRLGYMSAATLMGVEPTAYYTNVTYADIAATAKRVGIAPCAKHLYRRMVFNCFIRNTDDHLRNHGFLRDERGWRLSPIFDLSVHKPQRLVIAPAKGISPEANPSTAFHAYEQFGLSKAEAEGVYHDISSAMSQLPIVLDQYEVTARDKEILSDYWVHALSPPSIVSNTPVVKGISEPSSFEP